MTLDDIKERITPMLEDVSWSQKALESTDNAFTRRAYVRSLFAMIEGTLWVFKQTILNAAFEADQLRALSVAEFALLSESSFELKSNGKPLQRPKFIRLPENLRFTFDTVARFSRLPLKIGVGTQKWEAFLRAHSLRNRITHPKQPSDFRVTDLELEDCKSTNSWYYNLVLDVFRGLTS